jgi:hypothetical protein
MSGSGKSDNWSRDLPMRDLPQNGQFMLGIPPGSMQLLELIDLFYDSGYPGKIWLTGRENLIRQKEQRISSQRVLVTGRARRH